MEKINQELSTFLMFQKMDAEEAMNFYASLFPESIIHSVTYWAKGEGPEGKVKTAHFSLMGQAFMCMDSPIQHEFDFTPSVSIFVNFENESELERAYSLLSKNGQVLMELSHYGFSKKYGWVNDRFGISWQLNLPA